MVEELEAKPATKELLESDTNEGFKAVYTAVYSVAMAEPCAQDGQGRRCCRGRKVVERNRKTQVHDASYRLAEAC